MRGFDCIIRQQSREVFDKSAAYQCAGYYASTSDIQNRFAGSVTAYVRENQRYRSEGGGANRESLPDCCRRVS